MPERSCAHICLSVFFFFLGLMGSSPGVLKIVLQVQKGDYYLLRSLLNSSTHWHVVQMGLYLQKTDKQTEQT